MRLKRFVSGLTSAVVGAGMFTFLPALTDNVYAAEIVSNSFEESYEGWHPKYDAVTLTAEDGIGVLAAISMALADMKVSISQINTQPQKNGTIAINIHVGCKSTSHYESIVSRLRSIPSVISVSRGFSH